MRNEVSKKGERSGQPIRRRLIGAAGNTRNEERSIAEFGRETYERRRSDETGREHIGIDDKSSMPSKKMEPILLMG